MPEHLRSIIFTPDLVARWSAFTADANPLHTDAAFAATTRFGVPIVHGHLVASMALDALQDELGAAAVGDASIRFLAPIPVGSSVDLCWDATTAVLSACEHADGPPLVEVSVRPAVPHLHVTRELVDEYADAAHDRNSIHMSDAAARDSGFEGAIAHGMLTLGWAVARLMEQEGAHSLGALRARFAAPVAVGDSVRLEVGEHQESGLAFRVLRSDGTAAITGEAVHGLAAPGSITDLPEAAEVVADTVLRIGVDDAVRFARAIGCADGPSTSTECAHAAGLASAVTVPTLAFAAGPLGFQADDPANAGVAAPDAVADSQRWARTERPVLHAGQEFAFARPMLADERLRATTAVVERSERTRSGGQRLRFTRVRTVFRDEGGALVAMSEMNLAVVDDASATTTTTTEGR